MAITVAPPRVSDGCKRENLARASAREPAPPERLGAVHRDDPPQTRAGATRALLRWPSGGSPPGRSPPGSSQPRRSQPRRRSRRSQPGRSQPSRSSSRDARRRDARYECFADARCRGARRRVASPWDAGRSEGSPRGRGAWPARGGVTLYGTSIVPTVGGKAREHLRAPRRNVRGPRHREGSCRGPRDGRQGTRGRRSAPGRGGGGHPWNNVEGFGAEAIDEAPAR